jgi:CubicO group peptidase (beta-lactamase class C family)
MNLQRWIVLLAYCFLFSLSATTTAAPYPSKDFVRWLKKSMQQNKIPAVSIAVFKDYKIEWTLAYGYANVKTDQLINTHTLFQAGSVSKPVTAYAALYTVQAGKLALDEDVNRFMTNWNLPQNEYTELSDINLGQLLSHTAGLNVPGYPGYSADEKIPTLIESLSGQSPANTPAVEVVIIPGQTFVYSGGGYSIVQQMLTDIYQKPFPDIMDILVLQPLGMTHSTFLQPLPNHLREQIALPYHPNYESVRGGPHIYPELAAAGLWSTPFDLAKFMIAVQGSLRGGHHQLLDSDYAQLMVKPTADHMAMGFMGNMNKYGQPSSKGRYFLHGGQNDGYRCIVIGSITGGNGAVIMTNMAPDSRLVLNHTIKDNWHFIYTTLQRIADLENWR